MTILFHTTLPMYISLLVLQLNYRARFTVAQLMHFTFLTCITEVFITTLTWQLLQLCAANVDYCTDVRYYTRWACSARVV